MRDTMGIIIAIFFSFSVKAGAINNMNCNKIKGMIKKRDKKNVMLR